MTLSAAGPAAATVVTDADVITRHQSPLKRRRLCIVSIAIFVYRLPSSVITPPPILSRTGYCFRSISLFLSFFVSLSARLRENGLTDLHEMFREGVEWPRDDMITFLVNSEKLGDATKDVMKLLFLTFCYIATRGWGLLCFAPQLVMSPLGDIYAFASWQNRHFGGVFRP